MPYSQEFSIEDNQREGWWRVRDHFAQRDAAREVGVVLGILRKHASVCELPAAWLSNRGEII